MKRYIIEEKDSNGKYCDGCMFDVADECSIWPETGLKCLDLHREDNKTIIFVLVEEEEIK